MEPGDGSEADAVSGGDRVHKFFMGFGFTSANFLFFLLANT